MAVELRPALSGDADILAPRLRPADAAELAAMGKPNPLAALRQALVMTPDALAAVRGGQVIALLGCAPGGTLLVSCGVPWLLGAPECEREGRALVRDGSRLVALWARQHGDLANWVHAEHAVSIRWLTRLGFRFGPVMAHPVTGASVRGFGLGHQVRALLQ